MTTTYDLESSYFNRNTGKYGRWKTFKNYSTEDSVLKDYHAFFTNHPYRDSGHHTRYRVIRKTAEIIIQPPKEESVS